MELHFKGFDLVLFMYPPRQITIAWFDRIENKLNLPTYIRIWWDMQQIVYQYDIEKKTNHYIHNIKRSIVKPSLCLFEFFGKIVNSLLSNRSEVLWKIGNNLSAIQKVLIENTIFEPKKYEKRFYENKRNNQTIIWNNFRLRILKSRKKFTQQKLTCQNKWKSIHSCNWLDVRSQNEFSVSFEFSVQFIREISAFRLIIVI